MFLKKYGFLTIAVLTYFCMGALAVFYRTDHFLIEQVEVKGLKTVSKKELLRRMGIRPGYSSILFSSKDARREMLKNPWIKRVGIRRELPGRVIIEVEEERPFCLYLDQNGEMVYLSEEGKKLGTPNITYGLDFPVLISQGIEGRELLRNAIQILKLSLESSVLSWNEISEINLDSIYGLSVFTRDRRRINFGFNNVAVKWNRVEKIISHSRSINLTEKYININSESTGVVSFKF